MFSWTTLSCKDGINEGVDDVDLSLTPVEFMVWVQSAKSNLTHVDVYPFSASTASLTSRRVCVCARAMVGDTLGFVRTSADIL